VRTSTTPKSFGPGGGGGGFSRKVWLAVGVATISSHTRPKDFGVVEALTDHCRKRQGSFELAA
jgi:hypothetical protein